MKRLAEFEDLLKRTIGLDAASIGSSSIERALESRLSASGEASEQAYLERVRSSKAELQALIEAVVVPETWFFRDREAFTALARIATEEWLPSRAERVFQLLSLPCSTGEEPYSMAMALVDGGFPPNRFRVDAVDISSVALERAKRATYGRNSFRGEDLAFRGRHFSAGPGGHVLLESVRKRVHFRQGNLFDADLLAEGRYDVVFCRNVLIYFDRATQNRAVDLLSRAMTDRGVLFVAPSETGLLLQHGFVSAKMRLSFAFRKAGTAEPQPKAARPALKVQPPVKVAPLAGKVSMRPRRRSLPPPRVPSQRPRAQAPSKRPPAAAAGIEKATALADAGKVALAVEACEAQLAQHGPSADAFHLMGLLMDASGNSTAAEDFYRKALYLDPGHHEALTHLVTLLDSRGDLAGAKAARGRAERLARKAKKT